MHKRPDWWRQVQQWQRVRDKGSSWEGIWKEPVVSLQAQEKWMVRRSLVSDMVGRVRRWGAWDVELIGLGFDG